MNGNPLYHEFTFNGLDPEFVKYLVLSGIAVIVLTMLNTSYKLISWRCRGIRAAGSHRRACRRTFALRGASLSKDEHAIVLPSTSWVRNLALIWTFAAFWQGYSYHGLGYVQLLRNKFSFAAPIFFLVSLAIAFPIVDWVARKVIFIAIFTKVWLIVLQYRLAHKKMPPVAEKWGLSDLAFQIRYRAKKREEARMKASMKIESERQTIR